MDAATTNQNCGGSLIWFLKCVATCWTINCTHTHSHTQIHTGDSLWAFVEVSEVKVFFFQFKNVTFNSYKLLRMTTLSPNDCSDVTRVDVLPETLCFNSSDEKSPLWPPLVMNGMAPPWRSYVWWKVLQLAFICPLHVRVVLNNRTRTGFTNPVCIDNDVLFQTRSTDDPVLL